METKSPIYASVSFFNGSYNQKKRFLDRFSWGRRKDNNIHTVPFFYNVINHMLLTL